MKTCKHVKGWKVLLASGRRSVSDYYGSNKYTIEYPVNVEVFPKLEGSKLFFFRSKKCAHEFNADVDKEDYQKEGCNDTNHSKEIFLFIVIKHAGFLRMVQVSIFLMS